jgi:5'-nucleotidase (lipoprotein e(P4) family)
MRKAPLLLLAAWAAAGCTTVVASRPTPTPAETQAAPAAVKLPDSVHWFRNAAEYRALAIQTYLAATERLEEIAAEGAPAGSWAVALDADETVINNSQYNKERALQGLGYSPDSWKEWVERQAAPPIPGSVAFLQRVHTLGGKIAIVTNRTDEECPATEADFAKFQVPYDLMLCKTDTGEKEPRWKMIEDGTTPQGLPPLRIVMWVGDNIMDFPDLDQTLRTRPDDAFADFGRRFIVIPNPMYGSWESNPRD